MSKKKQYIEWDIDSNNVQYGLNVGLKAEFSNKKNFKNITYSTNTYDNFAPANVFYYSVDGGSSWLNYPLDSIGIAFDAPFKVKFLVTDAPCEFVYAIKNNIIYRISPDCSEIIDRYNCNFIVSSSSFDSRNQSLYLSGDEPIRYKMDVEDEISIDKSINVYSEPITIAVDNQRKSFWQINPDKVYLKDINGNEIMRFNVTPYLYGPYSRKKVVVNTFNGNLVFTERESDNDHIYECDRSNGSITHVVAPDSMRIQSICQYDYDRYLFSYGGTDIQNYNAVTKSIGVFDVLSSNVYSVCKGSGDVLYVVESGNMIKRFDTVSATYDWSFYVQNSSSGNISFRGSDNCIIYNDDLTIKCIRDDEYAAFEMGTTILADVGSIILNIGKYYRNSNPYVRIVQEWL